MKIQDACEDKGTLPEFPNMYCLIVSHLDTLLPCWYDAKTHHRAREVTGKEALRTDWLPFLEEKEIRPEKAGELWFNEANSNYYHTEVRHGALQMVGHYTSLSINQLMWPCWKRLFPHVEEDVERIEIGGVRFSHCKELAATVHLNGPADETERLAGILVSKGHKEMVLEYKKEGV